MGALPHEDVPPDNGDRYARALAALPPDVLAEEIENLAAAAAEADERGDRKPFSDALWRLRTRAWLLTSEDVAFAIAEADEAMARGSGDAVDVYEFVAQMRAKYRD